MSLYQKLFYEALRIRLIEERIISLYPSDKIQSPVHLSIGQEAVAVGLCKCLNSSDMLFINYRGHAHYLAMGGDLKKFFAELYGKKTGISGGKAGSMHLAYPQNGVMGASAIVGSTISHAVGAALAGLIKNQLGRLFVTVFGDGATEQGVFHESLNFASLYKLPVIFVCENNGLAIHSFQKSRQSYSLEKMIDAYDIQFIRVENGYDFVSIYEKLVLVLDEVRKNPRPVFVELMTERYMEHVGVCEDFNEGYRLSSDLQQWKMNDPLIMDTATYSKFFKTISEEIDSAVRFAEDSPWPELSALYEDVS